MVKLNDDDLFVKLCDRQANVEDLKNCNDDVFKNKYIKETIDILEFLKNNRQLNKRELTIYNNILNLVKKDYDLNNI